MGIHFLSDMAPSGDAHDFLGKLSAPQTKISAGYLSILYHTFPDCKHRFFCWVTDRRERRKAFYVGGGLFLRRKRLSCSSFFTKNYIQIRYNYVHEL